MTSSERLDALIEFLSSEPETKETNFVLVLAEMFERCDQGINELHDMLGEFPSDAYETKLDNLYHIVDNFLHYGESMREHESEHCRDCGSHLNEAHWVGCDLSTPNFGYSTYPT